jgi:asparagine synthase (glutamine-hydrolysing)
MCGIAGSWWMRGNVNEEEAREVALRMANKLVHRGPDSFGHWADGEAGIAFGHRRLSILDLSQAGAQPMRSASGRFVITYNGEIYNHLELRRRLEGANLAPRWAGHSDTETLLACIEAWGVAKTLSRLTGMFAFGLWDCRDRCLILARDRIGEKPLYYGHLDNAFVFASEIKAFGAHPAFNCSIDRGAVVLLLRHNYIPAPHSIFSRIQKLPPASWLRISDSAAGLPAAKSYWSLTSVAEDGATNLYTGSSREAADELDELLRGTIRRQMISDVPLGAFLSGGVDSSTIVALMQAQSSRPIRTFSIGFKETNYNEAEYAKTVAKYLGTEHTELYFTEEEALTVVPRLADIFDEPFADSSQLPTTLLAQITRKQVTVAMSGDGGDEFFGGYNRYVLGPRQWKRICWLPPRLRQFLGDLVTLLPINRSRIIQRGSNLTPTLATKLLNIADKLRLAKNIDDLYVLLVSEWSNLATVVYRGHALPTLLENRAAWPRLLAPENRMMALDALTYLPDDILVKVDRSAMAASLETRAPFLDHHIVEFAWRLPLEMKIRGSISKTLLRQVLYRYVPPKLIERPKQGFGIPLDSWLRGGLRDWAEDLLSEKRLVSEGFFNPSTIRSTWLAHLRGERNFGYRLWSVLMFQSWLDKHQRMPA